MRIKHRIGMKIAKSDVRTDPTSSREETRILPVPAVRREDFVRRETVTPWTMAAAPPPAIRANVHLRNGEISMTMEAVATIPATTEAGEVIKSRR